MLFFFTTDNSLFIRKPVLKKKTVTPHRHKEGGGWSIRYDIDVIYMYFKSIILYTPKASIHGQRMGIYKSFVKREVFKHMPFQAVI